MPHSKKQGVQINCTPCFLQYFSSNQFRPEGIGIAPEDLPRIWDRFYQADPSRANRDGSLGLGLSMVKEIARLHGGEVSAESELGKGSCFIVFLPA